MNEAPMIGRLAGASAKRDAIHIAIAPVIAGENLEPGDHIGIIEGSALKDAELTIGIVDPFLRKTVDEGERFFIFLYPNTITSLRHVWEHPAFKYIPIVS